MYEEAPVDFKKFFKSFKNFLRDRFLVTAIAVIIVAIISGFLSGIFAVGYFYNHPSQFKWLLSSIDKQDSGPVYIPQTSQEGAIISAVKKYSSAVVSIVITKDVPVMEQYFYNPFDGDIPLDFQVPGYRQNGTQKQEVGGGTGFLVSPDGLILTNKHVVSDDKADYTVITNQGKKYPAKVLAKDPAQDIALIKIEGDTKDFSFPVVKLGNSDNLQTGQTVIAIGNALGEFRNTVSAGVISGLQRTILASDIGTGTSETLQDIIQTDAAINHGNSGGPLLNLNGEVIGVNTAIAEAGQSIGFAIPINQAKRDIDQVQKTGKISYPFLGVRYQIIDQEIKDENKLPVDYGAWVKKDEVGNPGVTPKSPAEKAGIKGGDIILEFNGQKITQENSLSKIVSQYNPGEKVTLKILRPVRDASNIADAGGGQEEITVEAILEIRK